MSLSASGEAVKRRHVFRYEPNFLSIWDFCVPMLFVKKDLIKAHYENTLIQIFHLQKLKIFR